ncbi:peptidase M14 [Shewanella cyperi]|uniref:Peptidase M14 n=1 Tax=Shewanella cyperi TaxID=2814292 RepID=A0A974XMW2_9GAMM|nr:M14 family zinc carboxypeptidase [Shewanella cyperi]QSX29981.1 peptidase M14 [Shewanella cyperi]
MNSSLFCRVLLLCGLLLPLGSSAAQDKTDALETYLGYPLGSWHLRHDQINGFLQQLAAGSDRVSLESTGFSHEHREQLTAVITSPTNQARLAQILANRSRVKQGTAEQDLLVIWLAYSIHGDEASGAHAALALAQQLAQSREQWVQELLTQAVVLITPTQNPDGFDRFSTWANGNAGLNPVSDEEHREHMQAWPGGRYNHFLADLNRDWLFLRQPETRGRIALFHKWQPHLVCDFHEMGHNQSYFFQPGVPERTHPLTSKRNQELTDKLANFHRRALDGRKQPYFNRQSFDDFFYGKGSTYPDINGAVGMLFEQASARGQIQDSDFGPVSLQQAIGNHLTTSIASLQGALALKSDLLDYQRAFYRGKRNLGRSGKLLSTRGDGAARDDLATLLGQHQVQYSYLRQDIREDKKIFRAMDSLFVPDEQPQSALLAALFDQRTEFADATFYDVSAWDLASAYNLAVENDFRPEWEQLSELPLLHTKFEPSDAAVALLLDWRQGNAAAALAKLQARGVRVRVASKPFTQRQSGRNREYGPGTLLILLQQPGFEAGEIQALTQQLAHQFGLPLEQSLSAQAMVGADLGSDDFYPLTPIKPLLVSGRGSEPTEVGELWQYLDTRIGIPTPLVDSDRLEKVTLENYSHLLLADGDYMHLDEDVGRKLANFVNAGGVIIAQKGALIWLKKRNLLRTDVREDRFFLQQFSTAELSWEDRESFKARQAIGGAILEWQLDPLHPLSWGLGSASLPVMKNQVLGLADSSDPFVEAAHYRDPPLRNGFLAPEYGRAFGGTTAMVAEPRGKGAVVALADNLMFRNVWLGAERVYANALFFLPVAMGN